MFIAVLAVGKNNELGKNGDMPWGKSLTKDLNFVKELTMNKSLVMGSNTFNSLPCILKGRKHYVICKDTNVLDSKYSKDDPRIIIISNLDSFIKENESSKETFVIFGGASIYEQTLDYCSAIYLTVIDCEFKDADTFLKYSFLNENFKIEVLANEEENSFKYTRYLYTKK
ncbi:MAG: dihydrofolate reductase [Clostridia bacterium]